MIKVIKVKSYKEQQEEIRRSQQHQQQLDQGLKCEGDIKTYTSMEEYHRSKKLQNIEELLECAKSQGRIEQIKELETELKAFRTSVKHEDRKTILYNIKANIKAFIRSFISNKDNN